MPQSDGDDADEGNEAKEGVNPLLLAVRDLTWSLGLEAILCPHLGLARSAGGAIRPSVQHSVLFPETLSPCAKRRALVLLCPGRCLWGKQLLGSVFRVPGGTLPQDAELSALLVCSIGVFVDGSLFVGTDPWRGGPSEFLALHHEGKGRCNRRRSQVPPPPFPGPWRSPATCKFKSVSAIQESAALFAWPTH